MDLTFPFPICGRLDCWKKIKATFCISIEYLCYVAGKFVEIVLAETNLIQVFREA